MRFYQRLRFFLVGGAAVMRAGVRVLGYAVLMVIYYSILWGRCAVFMLIEGGWLCQL
ncbi:MAG: hypothetical protein GY796_30005 [Chloroflexi bacterium]|nr:hypothetical protein [Chloroflexota bacterium]